MEEVSRTSQMEIDTKVNSKKISLTAKLFGIVSLIKLSVKENGHTVRELHGSVSQLHVKFSSMEKSVILTLRQELQVLFMLKEESCTKEELGEKTFTKIDNITMTMIDNMNFTKIDSMTFQMEFRETMFIMNMHKMDFIETIEILNIFLKFKYNKIKLKFNIINENNCF
jgi:hypothetical protein